jgi:hypothetical protein
MRMKQSILEDYSEMKIISVKDIIRPEQKYIHFWDFLDLDDSVHELQAKLGIALRDLKRDISARYREYYTNVYVQTPEKFVSHGKELQDIEYMIESPLFLAILHFAMTKEIDNNDIRYWSLYFKRRLMARRSQIKRNIEMDLIEREKLLIR